MGYRSTLITQYYHYDLPAWFVEKYSKDIAVMSGTLIASKREFKIYDNTLFHDLQQALIEAGFFDTPILKAFNVAVLHEDGAVSKVDIYRSTIEYHLMGEEMELGSVWAV